MNFVDLTGREFHRLLVVGRGANTDKGLTRWICVCSCGTELLVLGVSLRSGNTKSCGCYQRQRSLETHTKTGESGGKNKRTRTYSTWNNMLSRCNTPTATEYDLYGGRGIKVCDDWMDYRNFLRDMGDRPQGMTLDRIDVNGNYCKENCRWATKIEQENNRRNNRIVIRKGEKMTLATFVRILGVSRNRVNYRLSLGMSADEIEEFFILETNNPWAASGQPARLT